MRVLRISLLIVCCTLICNQGITQFLVLGTLSEKNGLSNNIVNAMVRDREGFLWIGTFDGLNRYDGFHFTHYRNNRHQSNSIHNNTVHAVCVDKEDNIWCATVTGISCFRKNTNHFKIYFPDTMQRNAAYSDITCDPQGNIWCSGTTGLFYMNNKSGKFSRFELNQKKSINTSVTMVHKRGLCFSPDSTALWIATSKGLNCIELKTKAVTNYYNNPRTSIVFDTLNHYALTFDRQGYMLIGNDAPASISKYDPRNNTVETLDILQSAIKQGAAPPAFIFVDRTNRYWISTWNYSGFLYDPSTKKTTEFPEGKEFPYSLSSNFFWHALQDEEGTVWLGTVNGISYLNESFTPYQLHQPLKNASAVFEPHAINWFYEDDAGNWWITCFDRYELFRYDPQSGSLATYNLPPQDFGIRGIQQYSHYLIMNTNTGINGIDINTGKVGLPEELISLRNYLGRQVISWLRILDNTNFCLLGRDSGLVHYYLPDRTIKTLRLCENDFLRRNVNRSRGAAGIGDEKLYVVFSPLQLGVYDFLRNTFDSIPLQIDQQVNLIEGPAMNIKTDPFGIVWIALKEVGLIRYVPATKTTTLWQQSDGLVFNQVFDLTFDDLNRVWVAAYNKFSILDPRSWRFKNYTLPLDAADYSYTSRMLHLKNGNILGNIYRTLVEWKPSVLNSLKTNYTPLLSNIILRDSNIFVSKNREISLKHWQNNFTIEFGLLSGLPRSEYVLEYKLDGFENEWQQAVSTGSVHYNNVPEKKLQFRLRAVATDGSWTGKETTIIIHINPPFYRTTWFRILAALGLAAIFVLLVRLRINNVRRSEQQRSELSAMADNWKHKALRAQMNPHFIFNCMNSIDLYILRNDEENASRYLNKFAKLIRLILSHSDEIYVSLDKELEMLDHYVSLEQLRFEHPFQYHVVIDPSLVTREIEIPSMLLQPYVENAINHGLRHKKTNGHLWLKVSRTSDGIAVTIEDDGVGRERSYEINRKRHADHISKGSLVTEERLRILNTYQEKPAIKITDLYDEEGQSAGTKIEIFIPFDFDE